MRENGCYFDTYFHEHFQQTTDILFNYSYINLFLTRKRRRTLKEGENSE